MRERERENPYGGTERNRVKLARGYPFPYGVAYGKEGFAERTRFRGRVSVLVGAHHQLRKGHADRYGGTSAFPICEHARQGGDKTAAVHCQWQRHHHHSSSGTREGRPTSAMTQYNFALHQNVRINLNLKMDNYNC